MNVGLEEDVPKSSKMMLIIGGIIIVVVPALFISGVGIPDGMNMGEGYFLYLVITALFVVVGLGILGWLISLSEL